MPEPSSPVVAYLSVGANIEPQQNFVSALIRLNRLAPDLMVTGVSTVYRTEPIARPGRPFFLNGVWRVSTILSPRAMKWDILRPIEEALGRRRCGDAYADRPMDLDLLLYGDEVIDEPGLKIPNEDLSRPFVAAGLLELAPNIVVPAMRDRLADRVDVRMLAGEPLPEFTQKLREIVR